MRDEGYYFDGLFHEGEEPRRPRRQKSRLEIEFEIFDADNPRVWELFKRFAFEAIDKGKKKLSVALIVERIRWEVYIVTDSDDDFKVNNNHRAYYARKWIDAYPVYASFFNIRRLGGGGHGFKPDDE